MKVREAIQGLKEIRGILTKKERCFSDVMAKRAADGRGLTDEEVLTAVRLLRKYDIGRREDVGQRMVTWAVRLHASSAAASLAYPYRPLRAAICGPIQPTSRQ